MKHPLVSRLLAIALLMLLLLIPLTMIGNLASDRQQSRDSALASIASSASGSQQVVGPLLIVPYTRLIPAQGEVAAKEEHGQRVLLPTTFNAEVNAQTELRSRGIYDARLFHAAHTLSAHFDLTPGAGLEVDQGEYRFGTPYVVVGISDVRGIENDPQMTVNGKPGERFEPGAELGWLGDGIHAALPGVQTAEGASLDISLQLNLQGTGQWLIAPVGDNSHIALRADWPHPGFIGRFLPAQRSITAQGFEASWATTRLSSNLADTLRSCVKGHYCARVDDSSLGVDFVDPVDSYAQNSRAIKYGLLFIGLTFMGFFLFEVLKKVAVHPLQYALVGLALAMFFLLLLSLAEHIGFAWAYAVSALACIGLIGSYASHALQGRRNGWLLSAALAVLYGVLYVLLSAEDYALLMGAVLVFAMLGLFMTLTRRLDWYSVSPRRGAGGEHVQ
ncbi:cell envelope integrity protein CreD [Pseudomonas sp. KNUC1026]|uniref:cell envelope integrity protein CreD n=1 Tax=Pseudomonas sp. KNUC1026 TaxID=2893890 RepID=UPI001EFF2458|nr:cell envelope integrity protein CreD [Pseudomonas sp. KNUC1026]UFH48694.1 cell envelope integrity protein CreD [Pseudomonas sp. KNUC1026]